MTSQTTEQAPLQPPDPAGSPQGDMAPAGPPAPVPDYGMFEYQSILAKLARSNEITFGDFQAMTGLTGPDNEQGEKVFETMRMLGHISPEPTKNGGYQVWHAPEEGARPVAIGVAPLNIVKDPRDYADYGNPGELRDYKKHIAMPDPFVPGPVVPTAEEIRQEGNFPDASDRKLRRMARRYGRREWVHGHKADATDWLIEKSEKKPNLATKAIGAVINVERVFNRHDSLTERNALKRDRVKDELDYRAEMQRKAGQIALSGIVEPPAEPEAKLATWEERIMDVGRLESVYDHLAYGNSDGALEKTSPESLTAFFAESTELRESVAWHADGLKPDDLVGLPPILEAKLQSEVTRFADMLGPLYFTYLETVGDLDEYGTVLASPEELAEVVKGLQHQRDEETRQRHEAQSAAGSTPHTPEEEAALDAAREQAAAQAKAAEAAAVKTTQPEAEPETWEDRVIGEDRWESVFNYLSRGNSGKPLPKTSLESLTRFFAESIRLRESVAWHSYHIKRDDLVDMPPEAEAQLQAEIKRFADMLGPIYLEHLEARGTIDENGNVMESAEKLTKTAKAFHQLRVEEANKRRQNRKSAGKRK